MEGDKANIHGYSLAQTSGEGLGVRILVATLSDGIIASRGNSATNLVRLLRAPDLQWRLNQKILEQTLQIQFLLETLGALVPDSSEQAQLFEIVKSSSALQNRNRYCMKWQKTLDHLNEIQTPEDRRALLMNLLCFSICVEGLFSGSALAYLDFLNSYNILRPLNRGLGKSLRDSSWQIELALGVNDALIDTLSDSLSDSLSDRWSGSMNGEAGTPLLGAKVIDFVEQMVEDAIDCEMSFAEEMIAWGLTRLSLQDIRTYLEFKADESLQILKCPPRYNVQNPFLTEL
jgi:ribonucleoside-diphosphate reductase beta chain